MKFVLSDIKNPDIGYEANMMFILRDKQMAPFALFDTDNFCCSASKLYIVYIVWIKLDFEKNWEEGKDKNESNTFE